MEAPDARGKRTICRAHIVPRALSEVGVKCDVSDAIIEDIVARSGDPGMRSIKRDVKHVLQSYALITQCGPGVIGLSEKTRTDVLDVQLARTLLRDASPLLGGATPPPTMYS